MSEYIQEVTLADILNEREERVLRQNSFINKYNTAVICFTLNIAGPVKRTELIYHAFKSGEKEIEKILSDNNIIVKDSIFTDKFTGIEKIWCIDHDAVSIKKMLFSIEETHPLGRLFDIDVIKINGEKVSRDEIGVPERGCLICQSPGALCARNRVHSISDLMNHTNTMIQNYLEN